MQEKLDNAKDALALTITRRAIEQDIGKTIVDYAYDDNGKDKANTEIYNQQCTQVNETTFCRQDQ